MNRLLYRIVFNKARGMLMVVAEIARSCGGRSPTVGSGCHHRRICRLAALSLSLWLATGAIRVQASIVADTSAPGKQQPTIISSANGTTQVNIQTPSAGGVSRNTYRQFDVDQKGVILNNSHKNTTSELGGMVAANPWLAKGEATVILNEVNSRDPSRLQGYIEVAGQRAQVVIANPAGITCNGCGFINAGRGTLTTGTTQMQNGNITGYQVERGEIVVEGAGLDATRLDHTDIIARAVKVNAAIHAQDLQITAGRNRIDADHEQIVALADDGTTKPRLALDVSQVGGMYAGKIRLRGTENGVGVRNAGNIGAEAGTITLSAEGRIENSGSFWAAEEIAISSRAAIHNSGSIAARAHIALTGAEIASTGTLAAGVQPDGKTGNSGNVTLNASGKLAMQGQNFAGGNLYASADTLDASGSLTQAKNITLESKQNDLNVADARIIADGTLSVATPGTLNNNGGLLAADTLALNAHRLQNQKGQISQSGTQALTLNHKDGIDNREGVIIANASTLTVNAPSLDNRQGQIVAAGAGQLSVQTTQGTDNRQGILAAAGHVTLIAERLQNDIGGLVQSGNDLRLNVNHISNTTSGTAGGLVSQGNMAIAASLLLNDDGVILAGKQATLDTARFSNIAGTLMALDILNIATRSDTDNRQGWIQGKGIVLDTQSHPLDNREGTLFSQAHLQLTTAGVNNQHGQIQSIGSLVANAVSGVIDNARGLIRSGATITLNAASLLNRDTLAEEKGIEALDVVINSQQIDNATGAIFSGNTLHITNAGTLDNTQGALSAAVALMLNGEALRLVNTAGVVKAGENVTINAEALTGDGQLLTPGDMVIHTLQGFNNTGDVIANGNITFVTPGSITNSSNLLAGAKLDFNAADLLNTATGEIAAGATWLTLSSSLVNYGLIDGIQTWLKAGTLTNTGTGRIYGDHLSLQANTLNNLAQSGTAATLAGRWRVDIGAGILNNRDHALIYSDGDLAIGGQVDEYGIAIGQARTLNNHSATIESAGNMALSISQINNINDHFSTDVALISTEQMHEYQHKGLPERWDANTEGVFVDRNSADNLRNLNTPDKTGHNNDNFYEYNYTRTIEEEVITESDPARILAGGQMVIRADRLLNDKSQIVAGGTLGIFANTLDNVMPEGSRWITDEGSVTHYSRKTEKNSDSQRKSTSGYVPPVVIQSITLSPGRLEGNSRPEGSGMTISSVTARGTDTAIQDTGSPTVNVKEHPVDIPTHEVHDAIVRTMGPDTRLPDSSLFNTLPATDARYLVETDPRFTNNKQWLSSDYMQDAFALSHDNMHKRLGDGYYEQRLIREQIIALTGGRYLADHRDDEAQFKALMDAGIAFGKAHQLVPGVALSAGQMSQLTQDMVWLVSTQVQLADGSWQTVMVPQVYVRVQPGDVDGTGALLAGQNLVMDLNGDLLNSGTLRGREVLQLSADTLTNKAGTLQGADINLLARTDINNIAGTISAERAVQAVAGRDINLTTTTRSAQSAAGNNSFERTTLDRVSGITVQGDDGKLILSAGQDINLTAAQIASHGENSQTLLDAGRDLNFTTVTTSSSDNLTWDKDNWLKQSTTQQVGSEVTGKGDILMLAGRDVKAKAATVDAGGTLGVSAGRDITLTAATDSSSLEAHHKSTGSSGALSKKTLTTHDVVNRDTAQSSSFGGENVTMQAGRDLRLEGSDIIGDNDVRLSARNDLTLTTAEERSQERHQRQEKKTGFSGTGGIGLSYGNQNLEVTDDAYNIAHRGSTVGSINGDVTLVAGNDLLVNSTELIAGQDLTLAGKNVDIIAATESERQIHKVEQHTSGLTLALSGSMGSALDSAVRSTKQARGADNDRLATLQLVKAGLYGIQASQAARLDQAKGPQEDNNNTVGLSLSYGSQSSTTTQTREQTTASGSSLTAGNNLTVLATEGDIRVQGSQLSAENDLLLQASRDVSLESAQNTSRLDGKNESHGVSAGVGIGVGSGDLGITFSADVNAGKGKEKGNSTTHTETTVNAGNRLEIASGRDTTLAGAQASGQTVVVDAGRNLTLQSQQDTDSYNSNQQNISAGGTFTYGSMSGGGGISASRDKMDSDYKSVQEQTGIFAGDGGFDIRAGGHTQLDGAVIASTAAAENNRLDTGTLGWRDIRNRAEYSVEHQSAGFSSGGSAPPGEQFTGNMASNLLAGVESGDSAAGTTHAAIAGGDIIIRDNPHQQQDVATLSRDTANANGSIDAIFDKEKEQQKLEEAGLIVGIGNQVADIARTEGEIAKQAAMKDPATLSAAEARLRAEGKTNPTAQEIANEAGRTAMASYGTGSDIQRAIQAATAAVKGLAGGDMAGALAGAAAPYVAEIIGHRSGLEGLETTAAHAVANAALAAMQGQNALAGAAGAVAGELAGSLAKEMYGKEVADLSESQRQTISSLATIAAGIAGGLAGDSTAAALAGAQSGKGVVENNALGDGFQLPKGMVDYGLAAQSWNQYAEANGLSAEEKQAGLDSIAKGDLPEGANITKAIVEGYQDGAMIAGAWYLGPAAGISEIVTSSLLSGGVNTAYQWYDLSQSGNENKSWDYWGSAASFTMGALAPGRSIWANTGIAVGGSIFTDGLDAGSVGGTAIGSFAGGAFGKYTPGITKKIFGNDPFPGFIYEIGAGLTSEVGGKATEDLINRVGGKE